MHELYIGTVNYFNLLLNELSSIHLYIYIVPVLIFIEAPLYIIVMSGFLKEIIEEIFSTKNRHIVFYPKVSCIVPCYSEKKAVIATIKTLAEQRYNGVIEIIIMVDDALNNYETLNCAKRTAAEYKNNLNRIVKVIPKSSRGGLVSSRKLGLQLSTGSIVIVIDGDCSCDNDMVSHITRNFHNRNIVGVSGYLRVRNSQKNLLTRLQGIEYISGIQMFRLGLSGYNIINNISGAFGAFDRKFIKKIGGWRNGTAEDLDLTLRIKAYGRRYSNIKIIHDFKPVVHTDVPETIFDFIKQRLRWDGDMLFVYFKRFRKIIRPKFLGWRIFLGLFWYNILFCIIAPTATAFYLFYLLVGFPLPFVLALLVLLYIYYLIISLITYIIFLVTLSERKLFDLLNIWLLLIFPIYQLLLGFVSTAAFFIELTLKTHKNSNMAPWWVLRKTEGDVNEN